MNCVFCRIIAKEIPAEVVFENEKVMVFKDINPKAPVHLLIVTKEHIASVNDISSKNKELVGELFLVAQKVAKESGVKESGYKLAVNVGEGGGQEIAHLHIHLFGGWNNK